MPIVAFIFFEFPCKLSPPKDFLNPKTFLAKFTIERISGLFQAGVAAKKVFN
jgi:hypothetical protein